MGIEFDTESYLILGFVVLSLLLRKPRLIIYLLIVITILNPFFPGPISFGSINVYAKDLLLLSYCCCAGYVVFKRFISKERIFNVPDDAKTLMVFVFLYIALHVAYMFIGLYQGVSPDSILRRFSPYSGCLYFFFPILFLREKDQFKRLLIFVVIIAVLVPVLQIYSFIISAEWQRAITSSGTVRLGSAGLPIIACSIFTMLIFKKDFKYYIISASPILALVLVGHRSVLLALGISLLFLLSWTRGVTKSLIFVYVVTFSLLLILLAVENFTGYRFIDDSIKRGSDTFSSENKTTIARINAIKHNFYIFKKKPITGIGYNHESLKRIIFPPSSFGNNLLPGSYDITVGEFNVLHPHNFVLRFLSHTGIFGTLLIFTIIWLALKRCYSFIRTGGVLRNPGIFLFCSIVFFLILGLMNTTFFSEGYVFWFLCGTIFLLPENVVQNNDMHKRA